MDISLAALLGKGVYNFGELLLHPIVSHLPRALPTTCPTQLGPCANACVPAAATRHLHAARSQVSHAYLNPVDPSCRSRC